MKLFSVKNKIKEMPQGFSLIELLVTIAVLTIVSGVVFFNHAQFNNSVLVENLAYEISLVIRQAQFYGVQVKETEGSFNAGYGVYFDKTKPTEFLIFADKNLNYVYDAGADGEPVDMLRMTSGNKIEKLCAGNDCNVNYLNIGFLRPNPSAIIKTSAEGGTFATAEICIISPKGMRRKIFVNNVGQISIETECSI
ncbi:MAG: prepilin-type N-terminal cleavage/methylation domain-containing protein [Patescibacteria group bacterium]